MLKNQTAACWLNPFKQCNWELSFKVWLILWVSERPYILFTQMSKY